MRYPASVLEDIKARLPASVVVGRRVKLMKAGREWKGLSPFNAERSPSFFVNDQKQAWFDFSSGRNGDIFTFVMETEGLSFAEAVERLAGEAGVSLPKAEPEAIRQEQRRAGLNEAMEFAAAFFRAELKGPRGREAREYLVGRGLAGAVLERFGIGFAPNERYALRDYLAEKGVPIEVMLEAGLLATREDSDIPFDRFRERIMFPIADVKGRVIAFGGRAMRKDVAAKYLNSPETPIFHKGATLYNLHRARKAAHDAGTVYVVEGYVDAIALDRAGIAHAVAPLGTALTEEQMKLLWRLAPEPVLCFDGDKAGQRAAHRAIDVALPGLGPGRTLRFAFLPEGQDPDDLLKAQGPEALQAALGRVEPLVDVLFDREVSRLPHDTPEQRADLEKRLNIAVSQIGDEDLKRHYRQAMRERLQKLFAPQGGQQAQFQRRGERRPGPGGKWERPPPPLAASERLKRSALFAPVAPASAREAALVLGALNHPGIVEAEAEALAELVFQMPEARAVRGEILNLAAQWGGVDAGAGMHPPLAEAIAEGRFALDAERLRQVAALVETWTAPQVEFSHALAAWREAAHLHGRQSFLNSEIDSVSLDFAVNGGEERFERLKALVQRREALLATD